MSIFFLPFVLQYAFAQAPIIITGSRFTYPLIEKWKLEFQKQYPDVQIKIIPRGSINADSAHLIINAHKLKPEEIKGGNYVINIARYAILPVANSQMPLLKQWNEKGLKIKALKDLYFLKADEYERTETKKKAAGYQPTLYTRAQKACAPISFARKYGFVQDDILGKPIGGDDRHLITAIELDTNGITYSSINLIYNLDTRKPKDKIIPIPLDINSNGKIDEEERFYTDLDKAIVFLQSPKAKDIAIEHVNITYPAQVVLQNPNLKIWIEWILTQGQRYNTEMGFLPFETQKILDAQIELFNASTSAER